MFSYRYFIIIALIILTGVGFYVYHSEHREALFEVNFFSLNRGRAIFIRTPENKTILVGGGQNSEAIRVLTRLMPFYRKHIDYVVIPSATPAQIGGLIEIIDRYDIGEIIMPEIMATSTVLTQLLKKVIKKKIHIEEVKRGDELSIGGLNVKILFPYAEFKFNKSSLPELALGLEYKSTGIYLLGNLSKTIQKDILKHLDVMTTQNLIEFYNSAVEAKVLDDLVMALNPKLTFSTKEKTTRLISDGLSWERIK